MQTTTTTKYTPKSLYDMLDHVLDKAETFLHEKPTLSSNDRNRVLNRAYGAIQSIADVQMDAPRWQRLNDIRSRIFKEWERTGRTHYDDNYADHDGEPGDPFDYGDF